MSPHVCLRKYHSHEFSGFFLCQHNCTSEEWLSDVNLLVRHPSFHRLCDRDWEQETTAFSDNHETIAQPDQNRWHPPISLGSLAELHLRPGPRLHAGTAGIRWRSDGQIRGVHRGWRPRLSRLPFRDRAHHGLLRWQHRHCHGCSHLFSVLGCKKTKPTRAFQRPQPGIEPDLLSQFMRVLLFVGDGACVLTTYSKRGALL